MTMTTSTQVHVHEAQYVDPRSGSDKFYRVFVLDSTWVSQYGRNGTVGTFTKLVDAHTPEAAAKAADAKFAAKVRKGYEPTRSGTVTTGSTIGADDLSLLDELAESLPMTSAGETRIQHEPVAALDLGGARLDDVTTTIASALAELPPLPGRNAVPTDTIPVLPVRPMLASVPSQEALAAAMTDDDWCAQFKYDGDRLVIEVIDGQIHALNRQGQAKARNVAREHLSVFTALGTGRWVLDGEVVGRTLVLFDLAMATDGNTTWVDDGTPFDLRGLALEAIAEVLGLPWAGPAAMDAPIVLAPMGLYATGKDSFLITAIAQQREGIILRHRSGAYEHGRRSARLIKHKLIKDADVIVTGLHPTKESATLSVHDHEDTLVEVGAASTIGKQPEPAVDDVWSATFLYVHDPDHPRMVQPRLVRLRDDKAPDECTIDQFTDAGTDRSL